MNLCGLKKPTKTQNKTNPNQLQYQKSEMSNPLSNAWESKTAPGDVSSFSRRVLAQMPTGPSSTASTRRAATPLSSYRKERTPAVGQDLKPLFQLHCWSQGIATAVSHQAEDKSPLTGTTLGSLPSGEALPAPTQGTEQGNSSLTLPRHY